MISVDDVIRQSTEAAAVASAQTNQMRTKLAQQERLANTAANKQQEAAKLKAKVATVADEARLKTQQENAELAISAGISGPNEILNSMLAEMRQVATAYSAAANKVHEIERNSDLLGNPIGWLEDLLVGDEARADRDFLADKHANLSTMISNMNAAVSASAQAKILTTQTLTKEAILANSEALALQSQADHLTAQREAMQYSVEGLRLARQQTLEDSQRFIQHYNLLMQHKNYEMQVASYDFNKRKFEDSLKAIEDQKASQEVTYNIYRTASEAWGKVPFSREVFDANLNTKSVMGQAIDTMLVTGIPAFQRGSVVYGANPGITHLNATQLDSPEIYDRLADPQLKETHLQTLEQLNADVAEVQTMLGTPAAGSFVSPNGLTAKTINDPEAIAAVYNSIFTGKLREADRSFGKSMPLNILLAADSGIYGDLKNTAMWKAVIEPLQATGEVDVNRETVETLLHKFEAEINSGRIPEGQGIREAFIILNSGIRYYNDTSGRHAIGAQLLKDVAVSAKSVSASTITALASFPPPGILSTSFKMLGSKQMEEVIDITDENNFAAALNKRRAASIGENFRKELDNEQ